MHIHTTIASFRAARAKLKSLALVPTMGNLHAGHLALMHKARSHASTVAASIFVNRLQFRPNEDFDTYPRTLADDCQKLREAGVDHLFAPAENELYPQPQTYRIQPPSEIADILEGAFRPGFFTGVTTVVMKLFHIIQPDVALFGKKDYQQWRILANMAQAFNLPVEIIPGDTMRAEDGLALSSRNNYLSAPERTQATRLYSVLCDVQQQLRLGRRDYAALEEAAMVTLAQHAWQPDYVAIRRQSDLQCPAVHDSGLVVLAAARLGGTRLIDNLEV